MHKRKNKILAGKSLLIASVLLISSFTFCVKQKTKDPVPHLEFVDLAGAQKSGFTNSDTANMILSFEDGDGDIFVDNYTQGPNFIFTTYYWNPATSTFSAGYSLELKDTVRYGNTVKHPDNGYYKGKSIKGEILIPLTEFRRDDKAKIIKFTGFMVDTKQNKSNVFSSPAFTLNF